MALLQMPREALLADNYDAVVVQMLERVPDGLDTLHERSYQAVEERVRQETMALVPSAISVHEPQHQLLVLRVGFPDDSSWLHSGE